MSTEFETLRVYPFAEALPQTGNWLCILLSGEGNFESRARVKYPEIADMIDQSYESQRQAYLEKPTDLNLRRLRKTIGAVGAFNFIENMASVSRDGSANGVVASGMKLGPAAAAQVLEIADVNETDRVLELFSGAGYFTFSLALARPYSLHSVDLYSPDAYDLDGTFDLAYERIFSGLSDSLKPKPTKPSFIKGDCAELSKLSLGNNDKVFLHPPFGRESRKIVDLDEIQAYVLWLKSLLSVYGTNDSSSFQTYSVVPGEWVDAILEKREKREGLEQSLEVLRAKLGIEKSSPNSELGISEDEWRRLELILKTTESYTMQSRKVKIKLLKTRVIDPETNTKN